MQPEEEVEEEDELEEERDEEEMDEEDWHVYPGPVVVRDKGDPGPSIFGLKNVTAELKRRDRERERSSLGGKSPRSMSGLSGQHPNPPLILVSIRE